MSELLNITQRLQQIDEMTELAIKDGIRSRF